MPPGNNLPYSRSGFKREGPETPPCPYCGFKTCWRHGRYLRKGFHRGLEAAANLTLWVARCLCRSPDCGRSFCILPAAVLPYQRFLWPDFLCIADLAESGKNPYRIAAELALDGEGHRAMDTGLAVIGRTLRRIGAFHSWVERVAQELEVSILQGLKKRACDVLERLDWFGFTRRWFHALYPARISPEGNPHNSALNPQGLPV